MKKTSLFSYCLLILIFQTAEAKNIVFWLSVDGFRSDYIEKSHTPHLDKIIKSSLFSNKLTPVFPSLTFPGHISQATGVKANEHGITLNSFYDSKLDKTLGYPHEAKYLQATPIWQLVKQYSLSSAVWGWPLSHQQTGPYAADDFNQDYNSKLTDEERIEYTLKRWEHHLKQGKKLDLIMTYIEGPDSVGHTYGPEHPEVFKKVQSVDHLIGNLYQKLPEIMQEYYSKEDNLFFVITTDHGMLAVEYSINLNLLSNFPADQEIVTITGGNIGHVFLNKVPLQARAPLIKKLMQRYDDFSYLKAYKREELPSQWKYNHPERVGDIVLILDGGYIFSSRGKQIKVSIDELGGPLGMHGYDPKLHPQMQGIMLMSRFPSFKTPARLQEVSSLDLFPSILQIFNISPSKEIKGKTIKELHQQLGPDIP